MSEEEKSLIDTEEIEDITQPEVPLLPPDGFNKASELNVGNVFMVIFLAIFVIIFVVFLVSQNKGKKEKKASELDRAGAKWVSEIPIGLSQEESNDLIDTVPGISEIDNQSQGNAGSNSAGPVELPPGFDWDEPLLTNDYSPNNPGQAPIVNNNTSTESSTVYKSDRPDTRNSKSTRNLSEGLYGRSSSSSNYGNSSNNSTGSSYYITPDRDTYIAQQLANVSNYMGNTQNQSTSVPSYGNSTAALSQQNRENFFSQNNSSGTGSGYYLSRYSLWDGTIISGALVTGINTDNPGVVIARVTENVYSSQDSTYLLIPEGSLLYATYNSSVSYGQNRVQIAWNLLIRPDGYRVDLGGMNGVDNQGVSGSKGKVSNHPFEVARSMGIIGLFSIIETEVAATINSADNQYIQNALSGAFSATNNLSTGIIGNALSIKPTVVIPQGTTIKLITNKPLELPPVEVPEVTHTYRK